MNFLEAVTISQNSRTRPALIAYLRSDDLPFGLRTKARNIATKIENAEAGITKLTTGLEAVPDFSEYVPEHRRDMARRAQLAERHDAALVTAKKRTQTFFKRRNAYRFYREHGCWPWQR